jgi:integrase
VLSNAIGVPKRKIRPTKASPTLTADVEATGLRQKPALPLDDGTSFVILQDEGKPLDPDNWSRRVWPTIRKAAKLPPAVTVHCLRHSFGSLLLADGAPMKLVSEAMGHANVGITLNIYSHTLRAPSATATQHLDKHIPSEKPALRLVRTGAA